MFLPASCVLWIHETHEFIVQFIVSLVQIIVFSYTLLASKMCKSMVCSIDGIVVHRGHELFFTTSG